MALQQAITKRKRAPLKFPHEHIRIFWLLFYLVGSLLDLSSFFGRARGDGRTDDPKHNYRRDMQSAQKNSLIFFGNVTKNLHTQQL